VGEKPGGGAMITRKQVSTMFADFINRNSDLKTAIEIWNESLFDERFAAENPARRHWLRPLNRIEAEYIRLKGHEIAGKGLPYIAVKRMPNGSFAHFPHRFVLQEKYAKQLDDYLAHQCFKVAAAEFVA